MPYTRMSSYQYQSPLFGEAGQPNYGFLAKPAEPFQPDDAFDEDVFMLFRRSEYAAQVELACAKIFHKLMGYGPLMEIVQDETGAFFIASRRIKNFKEGYPALATEHDYTSITGLAAIRVISYFLCESDNHSGNFGIQSHGEVKRAYRLDMAESFDIEDMLPVDLTQNSLEHLPYIVEKGFDGDSARDLPLLYVTSPAFQTEKHDMIQRIAKTPFHEFEAILRETITSNHFAHLESQTALFLAMPEIPEEDKAELLKKFYDTVKPDEHSLDYMIALFAKRHQQWSMLVENNPVFAQDLTLSDEALFQAETNRYHVNGDSCDEEAPQFSLI